MMKQDHAEYVGDLLRDIGLSKIDGIVLVADPKGEFQEHWSYPGDQDGSGGMNTTRIAKCIHAQTQQKGKEDQQALALPDAQCP